ncbi:MAG TPA: hypothetical protein PKD52_04050 [Clostridiales bacterium]|nr:hypothetical protein [Clostridiales bacterium]
MIKLTPEQRVEMMTIVGRANTENIITVLEESGPLSDEEKEIIELCSMVSISAIGLALQYLCELYEKYH